MVAGEGPSQGESNVRSGTTGPLQGCGVSNGVSTEGDNVIHCVEGDVAEVHQQGLFLRNPDRESGGKKVRYWLGEPCLVDFDAADPEHERRNRAGCSSDGQEARDADGGVGIAAVGMWIGDQSEEEVAVVGSCNGEEGSDWRSGGGGLVRLPCNRRGRVIAGG